jgi:hypothetical protein
MKGDSHIVAGWHYLSGHFKKRRYVVSLAARGHSHGDFTDSPGMHNSEVAITLTEIDAKVRTWDMVLCRILGLVCHWPFIVCGVLSSLQANGRVSLPSNDIIIITSLSCFAWYVQPALV